MMYRCLKEDLIYFENCVDFTFLLKIFGGVIASQTSGKLEKQQNQINPSVHVPQLHNQSQIKTKERLNSLKLLRP